MKYLKPFIFLSSLVLSACGNSGSSGFKPGDGLTGKSKIVIDADTKAKVQSPYTISGFKAAYDALVKKMGQRNDKQLANAVSDVQVTLLDEKGQKTFSNPKALSVQFKFNSNSAAIPTALKFSASLSANGKGMSAIAKGDKKFQLLAYCFTQNCHRIELRLQRIGSETAKEIGLLVSKSHPTLKLIKPSTIRQYSDRGLKQLETSASRAYVEQNSVVTVSGFSFSELIVKSSVTATTSLLHILADLVDTENVVTEVTSVKLESGVNTRSKLVGNDSSTGDLMFELISGSEAVIILVEKDPAEIEQDEQLPQTKTAAQRDLSARAVPNSGLFPTNEKNHQGLALASDFASYSIHDRTQSFVDFYKKNDQRGVRNVFSYTHNVTPYIAKIFEKLNLTPEFAYIMPVESGYLKSGQFNSLQLTQVAEGGTAFGPWQILDGTAFDIKRRWGQNFSISEIKGYGAKRTVSLNDDRGYLIQSTYMAALYLQALNKMFPQDAGLVVMAYHAGEGRAGKALNKQYTDPEILAKIQNLAKRNITLELVEKYKMIGPDHRSYAFQFMAWREMGQNQERNGLNNIKKIDSDAFKKRLSRPNGPTPI